MFISRYDIRPGNGKGFPARFQTFMRMAKETTPGKEIPAVDISRPGYSFFGDVGYTWVSDPRQYSNYERARQMERQLQAKMPQTVTIRPAFQPSIIPALVPTPALPVALQTPIPEEIVGRNPIPSIQTTSPLSLSRSIYAAGFSRPSGTTYYSPARYKELLNRAETQHSQKAMIASGRRF